jgi:hypothetical protein
LWSVSSKIWTKFFLFTWIFYKCKTSCFLCGICTEVYEEDR